MGQIRLQRDSIPQQFKLEFKGALIGTLTLTRKGFALLGQPKPSPQGKKAKRKSGSPSRIQDRELLVKANQLGKAWRVARIKWHAGQGRRVQREPLNLPFVDSELKSLKRAVQIMSACGVSNYQLYIKAQVNGLRFCNGGKGLFPTVQHLATDGSELRLLEYVKAEKDENGDPLDIEISADERNTPLTENMKYMTLKDLVQDGKATRAEALYVMTLQAHRTGKVKPYVTRYMEQLNKAEVDAE